MVVNCLKKVNIYYFFEGSDCWWNFEINDLLAPNYRNNGINHSFF